MKLIHERNPIIPLSQACSLLHFSRANFYRKKKDPKDRKPRTSPRALSHNERQEILDLTHEERFMDSPPAQIFYRLLDEGRYIASERTIYRILSDNGEVKVRRELRKHPKYERPELLAKTPNELWSWDITRLRGPSKLEYYQLYVIIDVFSRYIVGWMLATTESAQLAKSLITQTCISQGIKRNELIIHSDRGPAMKSKTIADLMSHLGVVKSHSRPRVSNDNPYSESQFKTMKYCPTYPDRFGSIEDARAFCRDFFTWYNHEHYHSGINMLTPASVHQGKADEILRRRAEVKQEAFKNHKERFVNGRPKVQKLAREVWINAPITQKEYIVTENNAEVNCGNS